MTSDHFELATSLMVTAGITKASIDDQYAIRHKTPDVLVTITRLKDNLRHTLAMAKLHTGMANVQGLQDLRTEVERLFQALTAEPPPPEPKCFLGVGRERHLPGCNHLARLVVLPERES